jgi:hypothetical protein
MKTYGTSSGTIGFHRAEVKQLVLLRYFLGVHEDLSRINSET